MYTLVFNEALHETAAVLIKDDKIISGLEEERVSRNRHATGEHSGLVIKRLLEQEQISLNEVDEIVTNIIQNNADNFDVIDEITRFELTTRLGENYMKNIHKLPKIINPRGDHHYMHIASSFYTSGFEEAVCICLDGKGNCQDSISIAYANRKDGIKIIKKYHEKDSLGSLYFTASNLVSGYNSEGKFMGLASFGKPIAGELPLYYTEEGECINNIMKIDGRNIYDRYLAYFTNMHPFNLFKKYGYIDLPCGIMYFPNFAATIQECINISFVNLAKYVKKLYPNVNNLCLSGGVALNCTANGILDRENIFENIFCFPAANDAGTAWGMAYNYLAQKNIFVDRIHSAYYGPKYDIKKIIQNLPQELYNKHMIHSPEEVVDLILQNKVIAWYQDGSECGPRALGHRSFLGDPREGVNWHIISVIRKKREIYRPLAPIVLAEFYEEIFDDPHPDNLTEFMLKTVTIKPEWRDKIPAVCHVDFTARPQLLYRETNPELYDVIYAFYKRTGIPLLINTSFNEPNSPIVETLEEALKYVLLDKSKIHIIVNNKYDIQSMLSTK